MKVRRYHALEQSSLYRMPTRRKLAALLLVTPTDLRFLSSSANLYSHFPVAKNDGSLRMVDSPCAQLKRVQKRVAVLLGRVTPPDALFCPVKGRSYVDNAGRHRDGRVVHSLDIQKYFPTTARRRVYWFFNTIMKCPEDVAATLANLACCEDRLATGSPASPILAYYAHIDIWEKVALLAKAAGCNLSIYIDDMTLSGAHVPQQLIWAVKRRIHGGGLRYHKEKRSVDRACEVTGVIITSGELRAPNRQHRKVLQAKRAKDRHQDPEARAKILGTLAGLTGQLKQIASANSAPQPASAKWT